MISHRHCCGTGCAKAFVEIIDGSSFSLKHLLLARGKFPIN
jgi:hypothetical protein